jgi:hypothetical protein
MKCEVTQVNGDGSIRRALVDTANRHDAARWESLADQAHLDVPPPYEIVVDGRAVQIADGDLLGPLRELTIGVLTEGWQII